MRTKGGRSRFQSVPEKHLRDSSRKMLRASPQFQKSGFAKKRPAEKDSRNMGIKTSVRGTGIFRVLTATFL